VLPILTVKRSASEMNGGIVMEDEEMKHVNKTLMKYCIFAAGLVYGFFGKYIDSYELVRAILETVGLVFIFYDLTKMGVFIYKKLFVHKQVDSAQ